MHCERCRRALGEGPRVRRRGGGAICLGCLTEDERRRVVRTGIGERTHGTPATTRPADATGSAAAPAAASASAPGPGPGPGPAPGVVPFATGGEGDAFAPASSADAARSSSDSTNRGRLDPEAGRLHRFDPAGVRSGGAAAGDHDPAVEDLLLPDLEPAAPAPERGEPCPCCHRRRTAGVERCTACGFDPAVGVASSTRFIGRRLEGGAPACPGCGHLVRGIASLRCPECGADLVGERGHRAWRREEQSKSLASYCRTPLLMALAGLLVAGTVEGLAAAGGSAGAALSAIGFVLASYPILVAFGLGTYLVYAIVLTGIDAPLPFVAAQMAGIHGVMIGAGAVLGLVPVPLVGWLLGAAIYVHLLSEMLDLELNDAIAVAIVTWALRTAALTALAFAGV